MARTYRDEMFIDTFEHGYTWLNGFRRNVARFRNKTAVLDPQTGRQWTYGELDRAANRLAHALRADGVGKGDVVMTALANSPEFAVTYIGPRKVGGILNPVNCHLSPHELALLLEHNRPKVLIYSAEAAETAVQAVKCAQWKPARMVMADNWKGTALPAGHVTWERYLAGQPEEEPELDFRPHIYDEVLRLCTSGTTALPKCVPVNDINEVLSAHDIIMQFPLSANDRCLNMTPWFHRGGCHVGGPCPAFYVGATVVVMRAFRPRHALQWVGEYGITFLVGAPSSLEMLCRVQERDPVDLSRLKGLVTMGAPLEREACIRYREVLTPNLFNGYGTTETLWNSFLRPEDLPGHAGCAGRSCIDDEVRVVRCEEDRKAEPEELVPRDNETVGEILLWSPGKSSYSYYENPQMAEEKFYKGWMYTGDLGTWDEDGYVTVRGRKDDMILSSGENIYPAQVEEALSECPGVADVIVTWVPDPVRGQAVAAYVKAADPALTVRELAQFAMGSPRLAAYQRPRYYRMVEEIPYNATGKKQHFLAHQWAERDQKAGLLRRM